MSQPVLKENRATASLLTLVEILLGSLEGHHLPFMQSLIEDNPADEEFPHIYDGLVRYQLLLRDIAESHREFMENEGPSAS